MQSFKSEGGYRFFILKNHIRSTVDTNNKRHACFSILRFPVSVGQNRLAEPFVERRFCAQKPWHQEVKETPQFQHIILDRRPGQNESVLRSHAFNRFREFGFGVLDDVTFIKDTIEPVHMFKIRDIVSNDFVRCNDHIVFFQRR